VELENKKIIKLARPDGQKLKVGRNSPIVLSGTFYMKLKKRKNQVFSVGYM